MAKHREKNKNNATHPVEDVTQYGEFISSYHRWLTPEYQARRAEHLSREVK